jgi:ABC-type Fe3+/spermidine/putrescine transport system ATPase subunit
MSYVELRGLEKTFGRHRALQGVDLSIEEGEFVSLLGASGCGKTTTLRIVAGFEQPDRGDVRIDGASVLGRRPDKRGVGIVFQSYALFQHMTVLDNVAFGLRAQGIDKGEANRQAHEMLELVELHGAGARRAHELSGGQRQRVALARALAVKPRVLALDEPLGALDKKLREQMQLALTQLHRELGMTMIYVTHDQEEALSMSSRVAVMAAGAIQQYDAPAELYHSPANLYVFDFVGRSTMLRGKVDEVNSGSAVTENGLRGVARGELSRGASCVICVRPERVAIASAAPGARSSGNSVAGVIRDLVFHGQTTHYIIEVMGDPSNRGRRIEASVLSEHANAHLAIGTDVAVSFSPGAAFVYPDDDEAPGARSGATADASAVATAPSGSDDRESAAAKTAAPSVREETVDAGGAF